jgi:hypothetical protein
MSTSIVRYGLGKEEGCRNVVDGKHEIFYHKPKNLVRENYDQTIKYFLQHVAPVLLIGLLSYLAANSLSEILYVLLKPHIKLGNLLLQRLTNSTNNNDDELYEIPLMVPETYHGLIFVMFFGAFYSVRLYLLKYFYHNNMPNRINYRNHTNKNGNTTLRKRAKSPARFTQKRVIRG